jgi:hypothetical protein
MDCQYKAGKYLHPSLMFNVWQTSILLGQRQMRCSEGLHGPSSPPLIDPSLPLAECDIDFEVL